MLNKAYTVQKDDQIDEARGHILSAKILIGSLKHRQGKHHELLFNEDDLRLLTMSLDKALRALED